MNRLATSNYTPYENLSAMPQEKLQRLHFKESSGYHMPSLQVLRAIRRSCKYGLLNLSQALGQSVTIHFILDGYDKHGWETVIGKAMVKSKDMMRGSGMAVPVTTSEIRVLYRNWHTIKQRVIFYEKDAEVDPPWKQDTRWMQYGMARYEKHKKELIGQVTQDTDLKLFDSYIQNTDQICKSGYPNQATDELKIAPVFLTALKTPLPPVLEDDEF